MARHRLAVAVVVLIAVIGVGWWVTIGSSQPVRCSLPASASVRPNYLDIQKFSGRTVDEVLQTLGGAGGTNLDRPIREFSLIDLDDPGRKTGVVNAGNWVVVNAVFDHLGDSSDYVLWLGVVEPGSVTAHREDIDERRTGLTDWGLDSDIVLAKALGRDPAESPEQALAVLRTER